MTGYILLREKERELDEKEMALPAYLLLHSVPHICPRADVGSHRELMGMYGSAFNTTND